MKSIFTAMFLVAMVILVAAPSRSYAQTDTIWVNANPAGNINNVIQGDTLANGQRAHPGAVYALYRDSLYFYMATIAAKGSLSIVAPEGSGVPPVIAPGVLPDGSTTWTFFNLDEGNLTLRNLYILGVGPNNQWAGWATVVNVNSDSSTVTIDNCVLDQWSNGVVDQFGNWDNFYFTNNFFMNDIHSSSYFGGHAWESHGVPTDTCEMVNNTFFNDNSYVHCPTDYVKVDRFEHNTVCLNMVNPMYEFVESNELIRNNIFYGTLAIGQQIDEFYGGWYDDLPYGSSTISVDTLYGLENLFPITEATRKIDVSHNAYFWPSKLVNFWTAYNDTVTKMVAVSYQDSLFNPNHGPNDTLVVRDTVKAVLVTPIWMNGRTINMFTNKSKWPGLTMSANDSVDPGFPAVVASQLDSAIKYVIGIRTSTSQGYMWDYYPSGTLFSWKWPLPSLAYTNASLQSAGSDGFALGDLNQFPSQKAAWLAAGGMATGVKAIPNAVPAKFDLSNNYPNPFNPSTVVKVSLPQSGVASLKVYNVLGQLIMTVDQGFKAKGEYTYTINMDNFASGVYFYALQQGSNSITKKMLLLK